MWLNRIHVCKTLNTLYTILDMNAKDIFTTLNNKCILELKLWLTNIMCQNNAIVNSYQHIIQLLWDTF